MNVAFSVGDKSRMIADTLKKSADNVDFYTYATIQEMIQESVARHISFSRIIFSTQILNKIDPASDLRELNDFIRNFSSSSEIVMLMAQTKDDRVDEVFNSMFNSPLYTPIVLPRATASSLMQVVTGDMATLRSQYYVSDNRRDPTLVSAGGVEKPDVQTNVQAKEEPPVKGRRGLLGIFKGGRGKTSGEKLEPVSAEKSDSKNAVNSGNFTSKSDVQNGNANISPTSGNDINTGGNQNLFENNLEKTSYSNPAGSPVTGPSGLGSDFLNSASMDDELSIGDLGEQHVDTGFLDEEEEELLKRQLESGGMGSDVHSEKQGVSENSDSAEDLSSTGEIRVAVSEEDAWNTDSDEWTNSIQQGKDTGAVQNEVFTQKENTPADRKSPFDSSSVDLIIGLPGSGVAQYIVDTAVKLADEGSRVLIVDLAVGRNDLLSYMDTDRFYVSGSYEGISKLRTYSEDGVDVVSNGYGEDVTARAIEGLFSSRMFFSYDRILVDCPPEVLPLVGESLLRKCNICIRCSVDRCDLLAMSLALTKMGILDVGSERYVMGNCSVQLTGRLDSETREGIGWVKDRCLFANGSWLDKISA